jgi:hypothetical protein
MTIDEQIKKADAKIAEIEAALRVAQEHRRELVNRGNLNKRWYGGRFNGRCERGVHSYVDMLGRCIVCGEQVL